MCQEIDARLIVTNFDFKRAVLGERGLKSAVLRLPLVNLLIAGLQELIKAPKLGLRSTELINLDFILAKAALVLVNLLIGSL